MLTTLHDGDCGIVFDFEKVSVGDIIVFNKNLDDESVQCIKRVIAVGGDVVCIKHGVVFVNDEEITDYAWADSYSGDFSQVEVPEGCLYVLGDNRDISYDSRYMDFGFVNDNDVIGVFHKF